MTAMLLATLMMLAAPQDADVARPAQDADGTQRWSILVDPCASARTGDDSIVVCGKEAIAPRLPMPEDRGIPDRPMPSNPDLSGSGALAASVAPCATSSQGCTTGVNILGGATFLVRAVGKLIDKDSCCEEPGEATNPFMLVGDAVSVAKRALKKKPDKSKRVPILLDDPVVEAKPETAP